jgi:hypothetical protein
VQAIKGEVQAWLDIGDVSSAGPFDAIFVDVPIGENDRPSLNLFQALLTVSDDNTAIVVSSGSSPTLSDINTETDSSPREQLIVEASEKNEEREFLVYDEVSIELDKAMHSKIKNVTNLLPPSTVSR